MKQSMCQRKSPESRGRAAFSARRSGRLMVFWARGWRHHVARQPKPRQKTNGEIGVVNFPPAMTMARRARIGMMVVMPAFAVGDEADNDVVAAVLVGLVIPVTPQMRHRINSPRDMPYQYRADEHAEHHDAKSGLRRSRRRLA